jgi:hypothetical protein
MQTTFGWSEILGWRRRYRPSAEADVGKRPASAFSMPMPPACWAGKSERVEAGGSGGDHVRGVITGLQRQPAVARSRRQCGRESGAHSERAPALMDRPKSSARVIVPTPTIAPDSLAMA